MCAQQYLVIQCCISKRVENALWTILTLNKTSVGELIAIKMCGCGNTPSTLCTCTEDAAWLGLKKVRLIIISYVLKVFGVEVFQVKWNALILEVW